MTVLADYFIESDPARLVGMCGAETPEQVRGLAGEIREEVELAGLAHDAGKVLYIDTVSLSSRQLTGREFSIIRQHPVQGHAVLSRDGFGCIPHVVLGHHRWHNGSKGYPRGFDNTASPWRFVIDICAVADSIDAATDALGRSYGHTLAPDEVMDEVMAMAGTRYSPVVAAALGDAALRRRITDLLRNERPTAYFHAYRELEGRPGIG